MEAINIEETNFKKKIYYDLYTLNNKKKSSSVWQNIGFQNQKLWAQIPFFQQK